MSNEYKDWMVDRINDVEWSLAKAIIALQAYADCDKEEYKTLLDGKIAKDAINEIDSNIDLSTIFEKWDHNKYK